MKPMTLKEPTKCCASPTLLWSPDKHYYICPCGAFKANLLGRPVGNKAFVIGKMRHKQERPRLTTP